MFYDKVIRAKLLKVWDNRPVCCGQGCFYPHSLTLTVFPQIVLSQLPEAFEPLRVSLQLIATLHSQTSVVAFSKDLHMSQEPESEENPMGWPSRGPRYTVSYPENYRHPQLSLPCTGQEEDQCAILDFEPKNRDRPILLP